MKSILFLICALALAGCAAGSIPLSETTPPSPERVFYHATPSPAATLIVIRDGMSMYGNERREIMLDGALAAKMGPAESLQLQVSPGEHILGSRSFFGSITSATVIADAGKTYYFRAGNDSNGAVTFMRAMSADQ